MLWALALQLRRDVLATRTQSVQELTYLLGQASLAVAAATHIVRWTFCGSQLLPDRSACLPLHVEFVVFILD